MKFKKLLLLLVWGLTVGVAQAATEAADTLALRFASRTEARQLLLAEDEFSTHLNQFDYNLRLRKTGATRQEWQELVQRETLDWTPSETMRIVRAVRNLQHRVDSMQLHLPYPEQLVFVKTTMHEELDAGGYTRSHWIALAESVVQRAPEALLERLIAHELFHVLTRHSHAFKKTVYSTIGFTVMDHEIAYPDDILEMRLSNPDISRRDSYIPLTVNGRETRCAEMIYVDRPYVDGSVFDYIQIGFVPLDEEFKPVAKDGKTVMYPLAMVQDEFLKKVGTNTDYNIDPEEISADHFSFLLTNRQGLPNPEIIENIQKLLQQF